jgi:hypothetical protein
MYRYALILPFIVLLVFSLAPCNPPTVWADAAPDRSSIKLLLTSNIQGRSSSVPEGQHTQDPLLVLAQNLVAENRKGVDLYLDLGNAFYPGVISKFSSGSIMMDFLDEFQCQATLVSSMDLHVGIKNLEFLQRNRNVQLLSSNIAHPDGNVFAPYFIAEVRGIRIAFVGLSSERLEFDIAEKDLYGISLMDPGEALIPVLESIGAAGVNHIVLLTGLKPESVISLLERFPQIGLALCGGDSTGILYAGLASRIDLADGRSILMMNEHYDYFTVELQVHETIRSATLHPHKALPLKSRQRAYNRFADRLTLWKNAYLAEKNRPVADTGEEQIVLDDHRLSQLLRDRFNSEIAIVDKNTLNPSYPIMQTVRRSDLLGLVNLDYNIFTFSISGRELKIVTNRARSELEIVGPELGKSLLVQGYPVDDRRKYKVAATQPAFEKVEKLLGRSIPFTNNWKTVSTLLAEDLSDERVTLREDYTYLDRRFRTIFDIYLSNFVAYGSVKRDGDIGTPVAQPAQSYSRWGLEDRIDWTIYNEKHRFVLTPYLFYVRQDDDYIHNILRGTVLYEFNLSEYVRPYNKFQIDTVVESIEGRRPMLIRETMGVSAYFNHVNGRLGLGFEKQVQDPSDDALFGLEFIIGFQYRFRDHLTYLFGIDNFATFRSQEGRHWRLRSSIDNALVIRINDYLSISLKHKYFYLDEDGHCGTYRSSQFFTTVDLRTDWKLW